MTPLTALYAFRQSVKRCASVQVPPGYASASILMTTIHAGGARQGQAQDLP